MGVDVRVLLSDDIEAAADRSGPQGLRVILSSSKAESLRSWSDVNCRPFGVLSPKSDVKVHHISFMICTPATKDLLKVLGAKDRLPNL